MRGHIWAAILAAATIGAAACVHRPPPLPAEPPDVRGTVWALHGHFGGGGTVVVRTDATPDDAMPLPDRIELRPGARILIRRQGRLEDANFSRLQLGQHVTAWWDGEPTRESTGRAGPVRLLVIGS